MSRLPRIVATVSIVLGVLAFVLGVAVYVLVHNELADQKITVSDDRRSSLETRSTARSPRMPKRWQSTIMLSKPAGVSPTRNSNRMIRHAKPS